MAELPGATLKITVPDAINQLLQIVWHLQITHPKKKFTLDGRLIGDLGETLVENAYDVETFERIEKHHYGETGNGRLVKIKATMKKHLTFPASHVPDYYLGIQIHRVGAFSEVFNGPGDIATRAVKGRQLPKTNLHGISVTTLKTRIGYLGDPTNSPVEGRPPGRGKRSWKDRSVNDGA